MELKFEIDNFIKEQHLSFNRTFMELKYFSLEAIYTDKEF